MKFDYNSELDILTVEDRDYGDYSESREFANFVVDFSDEGEVIGVEIIDASEATPLDREALKSIAEVRCEARRTDEFLEVSLIITIGDTENVVSSNFPIDSGVEA